MFNYFLGLTWWVTGAYLVYTIYFVFRTWYIFRETMDEGFFRGLFDVYLGEAVAIRDKEWNVIGYEPKNLRLYHIIWMVIDIPCIAIGSLLPFIRRVFTLKIATIKRPDKEEDI